MCQFLDSSISETSMMNSFYLWFLFLGRYRPLSERIERGCELSETTSYPSSEQRYPSREPSMLFIVLLRTDLSLSEVLVSLSREQLTLEDEVLLVVRIACLTLGEEQSASRNR